MKTEQTQKKDVLPRTEIEFSKKEKDREKDLQEGKHHGQQNDKGLMKIFILSFALLFSTIAMADSEHDSPNGFLVEICDNGIDDDGDGLVDGADPDCSGQKIIGGVNLGSLPDYLFFFADGRDLAEWQSPTPGYVGDVAIDGTQAIEVTSGDVVFAGTIYTNASSVGDWVDIVAYNVPPIVSPAQAFTSTVENTRIAGLETELSNVFSQINALPESAGYSNVAATSLDGLNTQNSIAETFVINITSDLDLSDPVNITGDAEDVFIFRWDSDGDPTNGYQGKVDLSHGGGMVPYGGLMPSNFINVAGNITSSNAGSNPPPPYPQGPRLNNGTGALIANGEDFDGGGFFTGYWFTTGDPVTGKSDSFSNARFIGGWYTTAKDFSLTSNSGGVNVSPNPATLPPEICDNVIDDDGDGLTDCADPDCPCYTCLAITGTTNNPSICNGTDGSIQLTVSSGTAPYSFNWTNGLASGSGSASTISGLAEGNYTIAIADSGTCTDTVYIELFDPNGCNMTACLGEAANYAILGLEGGNFIVNSATNVHGDFGYSANVTSMDNKKAGNNGPFSGTAYVHSNVASFTYNVGDFLPSGGIVQNNATEDARLDQANIDALATWTYFSSKTPDITLGVLSDNDDRTVNRVGPTTVVEITSLDYNTDVLTLVGQAGQDDAFIINVLGNFDFSCSVVSLVNVRPEMVVFNFPNSSTILINKDCSVFNGTILAPTSSLAYHNPATFNGAIIAPNIYVHSDFNIFHKPLEITCTEICGNGLDDDGDGLADCADPDCGGIPTATISADDETLCAGEAATLLASVAGGTGPFTYAWSNGLGSGDVQVVSPLATTTYTVTVTTGFGCTATDQTVVTINENPIPNAGGDVTLCSGTTTALNASASGGDLPYSFDWDNGLGSGASKSVIPLSTTTYTVTVTTSQGCSDIDNVTIQVNQNPVADAGADVTICKLFSTNLTASATGGTSPYNYNWGPLGTGAVKTVSPSTTKTYTVTITSNNGCRDTDNVTVTVVNNCVEDCSNGTDDDGDGLVDCDDPGCGPTVTASGDVNVCLGSSTIIFVSASGGNGPLTYTWSNGLGVGQSHSVSPASNVTYTVTVSAPGGCSAVDQVTVSVVTCGENCTNGIDDDGDGLVDCNDPDCAGISAPIVVDDNFTTCPAMPFSDRVTYNDGNLQNPLFSIYSNPSYGVVSIDATGKFTYTPNSIDCAVDVFMYEVCNSASGCCSQATVTLIIGDNTPPTLTNVPADLTIGCDDAVPVAPTIIAFDECPGIYVNFEESSSQNYAGACGAYTITRTWTATDLCGNSVTGDQTIIVEDQTKPEIFQVYTLENGQRVIAGIANRVTHDWKYVPFPITFSETPMIFTSVVTENDPSAVTVRQRNPYSQGFELSLSEEENNDGNHSPENVAWMAIEPGTDLGSIVLEAGRWQNVGSNPVALTFSGYFGNNPGLITSIQSSNDKEPATERLSALTDGSVNAFVQEEQSADAEQSHGLEHIGYLAFVPEVDLKDAKGSVFGETGKMNLTNAWASVTLKGSYTKPVVVFGGISNNDPDGANVRIRNLTSNSFEARIQEWDYLDGNHAAESVSWMVMEGAIPGNQSYYCGGRGNDLKVGVNVFAMDNCDDQVAFGYSETPAVQNNGTLTLRNWMAIDDCGNTNLIVRYDTCATAALYAKAMLNGPVQGIGNAARMKDDLRTKQIIPLEEPFSSLPAFPHVEDTTPNGTQGNNNTPPDTTASIVPLPNGALTAPYRTIADGEWTNPATWQSGNVPPMGNVLNKRISIEHQVTLPTGDLQMKNDTRIWVTNGALVLGTGTIYLQNSSLRVNNSHLETTIGDIYPWSGYDTVEIRNSEVIVGNDFINESGLRVLENVCLTVGKDFACGYLGVYDSLLNVTATIHGDFKNHFKGTIHAVDSKFRLTTGGVSNAANCTFTGSNLVFWIENGGITNSLTGIWTAQVNQYCVSTSVLGLGLNLPLSEDCSGMADYFNNVSCLLPVDPVVTPPVVNGPTLTAFEIALSGTLEPTLLDVEGDAAIVDWLLIELRDPNVVSEIIDYATVVVLRDGSILNEDGGPLINFPEVMEGYYFVTIKHRNHLGMMTNDSVYLSTNDPPMLDFSDKTFPVRGNGLGGKVAGDNQMMWGGDFNEDGKVIYQGPNNDIFYLFSRALSAEDNTDFLANFIVQGYDLHDFNLDGQVIYQGPNNDRAPLLYQSVLSHSANGGFLANFIVVGQLP